MALARYALGARLAVFPTLLGVWLYALLVGAPPSALRAAVMLSAALVAQASGRLLLETGVGLVFHPLSKPVQPLLGQLAGTQPARTYYVRVEWIDANGAASSPSDTAGITTQEGSALTVRAIGAPPSATGWHVYAGLLDDQVQRQNNAALALGATWTLPSTGLVEGSMPGTGQTAEYYLRHINVLHRG